MATNTERIDQNQKDIQQIRIELVRQQSIAQAAKDGIESVVNRMEGIEKTLQEMRAELSEIRTAVARQDERLKALEKLGDHPATLASHDQRLKALEKGNDRLWQFAPLVLATFALLVSIYSAFIKK